MATTKIALAAILASLAVVRASPDGVHHQHVQQVVPVAQTVVSGAVARTQYHAQNQASGEYIYGYVEPNGAKEERKLPDGTVLGSYTYAAPNGQLVTNNYVSDQHGFRSSLAPTLPKDNAYAAHNIVDLPEQVHHVQHVAHPVQQEVHVAHPVQQQVHVAPVAVHQETHHQVHHQQITHAAQVAVPLAPPPQHVAIAKPVAVAHQQIVDAPPQVHVQEKSYHSNHPHPSVVHEQVQTIVDPKPVVLTHGARTRYGEPILTVTPAPGAIGVPISTTPAVAYEKVVVSPKVALEIKEENYYKPPTIFKNAYQDPHHGHHVERTYAEAGVSLKRTHIDPNPTKIVETTYHDNDHHQAQVVRTTIVDPNPVVTEEKRVHPLPVAHHTQVHHGIPLAHAYASAPAYVETPVVKVHQEVKPVPVYVPRSEPIYYSQFPRHEVVKTEIVEVERPPKVVEVHHYPKVVKAAKAYHPRPTYYHHAPAAKSSVYVKQYHKGSSPSYQYRRRSYGHGHGSYRQYRSNSYPVRNHYHSSSRSYSRRW